MIYGYTSLTMCKSLWTGREFTMPFIWVEIVPKFIKVELFILASLDKWVERLLGCIMCGVFESVDRGH